MVFYKNLIDKKRFEGVEPDTPIEQYTNEYEIDIKQVEEGRYKNY